MKALSNRFGLALIIILMLSTFPPVWALQIERPGKNYFEYINKTLTSANKSTNNMCSVGLGAYLHTYNPDSDDDDENAITMNASVIANTRTGIQYTCQDGIGSIPGWMKEDWGNIASVRFNSSNVVNGTRVYFLDGYRFKFYGGEYVSDSHKGLSCSVWISANGFLSFDLSNSNLTRPDSMPDSSAPNAIIAPLWTDLTIDGNSRIIAMHVWDNSFPAKNFFVVVWKNALHAGQRLTFSVALEWHTEWQESQPATKGGLIYMAYENVVNVGPFAHGVEDQGGRKGVGALESVGSNWLGDHNGAYIVISQSTNNVFVKSLVLQFSDSASQNVKYKFLDMSNCRGYNVLTTSGAEMDTSSAFTETLFGAVGALTDLDDLYHVLACGAAITCAGIADGILSFALIAWDLYSIYKANQYNSITGMSYHDSYHNGGWPGNLTAAAQIPTNSDVVVDASFDVKFALYLLPKNDFTVNHEVTIKAGVEYQEYSSSESYWVYANTAFSIGPDSNNSFDTASKITEGEFGQDPMLWLANAGYDNVDYYSMPLFEKDTVNLTMTPPLGQNFDLYVYNPINRDCFAFWSNESGAGEMESIDFVANITGWWTVKVISSGGQGFYHMTLNIRGCADINDDNFTDIFDAIILANSFNKRSGQPGYNGNADLNHDSVVDIYDALILASHFGQNEWKPSGSGGSGSRGGKSLMAFMLGETTSVFVDPSQTSVFRDEVFTVNVKVTSVTNLLGWELELYWNNTLLNCTNAVVQTPVEWQNNTQNFGPGLEAGYNDTHARFWIAQSANDPAPPFNGSLTLVTLTFQALQPGTTFLTLADVKLGNSTAQPIDYAVSGGSVTVYYGRYMRSDTQQVNGLSAYKLNIPQSTSSAVNTQSGNGMGALFGIRAWVRHSNGVEQEIGLDGQTGTPKATVGGGFAGMKSSTVSVAQISLQSADSLVVRVYVQIAEGSWNLCATFTTEQLQSSTLIQTTWTVYYYTSSTYNRITDRTTAKFSWGTRTYNSRIQNLQCN